MTAKTVTVVPGSMRARTSIALIRLAGSLSRPFGHKGFWHAAHHLGRFGAGEVCTVQVGEASRFSFPCDDPYWSRMVAASYEYEAEILEFLRKLRGHRYAFLDCGANFGLWSVVCSEPAAGAERVVAIEASSSVLQNLRRNWELNGKRFELLHHAIFSESGKVVRIEQEGGNHAGGSIGGATGLEVETITIDDIIETRGDGELPWIIKLDVEGVEVPALEGAKQALAGAAIVIYEDHGNDPTSKVTAYVRERLGLDVFFREQNGDYVPINTAQDASRYKLNRSVGYNFFAVTAKARALFERISKPR